MYRRVTSLLIGGAALLALYPVARLATAQPHPAPSLMFVQTAQPAQTVFFTDRPNRVVGNISTDAFTGKWTTDTGPKGFAKDPQTPR